MTNKTNTQAVYDERGDLINPGPTKPFYGLDERGDPLGPPKHIPHAECPIPTNPMLAQGGPVVHPTHYNQGKIEVIDAIEDWKLGFNAGNAVKYIARHEHKGKAIQDLEKAKWYIDREIARLKGK